MCVYVYIHIYTDPCTQIYRTSERTSDSSFLYKIYILRILAEFWSRTTNNHPLLGEDKFNFTEINAGESRPSTPPLPPFPRRSVDFPPRFERFRSLKERTRGAIHVAGRGVVLDSQGPVLISEPRSSVEFSNETGAMIHCSAQGSPLPRIDWLMGDESPVLPIPHIREMLVNGSMYFLPFGAETYRHDVHSAVYRCQASNSVGRVLGREITVKAGEYLYFFTSDRLTSFTFPFFLPSPRVVTFYFINRDSSYFFLFVSFFPSLPFFL